MKYRFEFIKTQNSDYFKFAGVGFAGNIFIILNALSNLSDNDELYIDMETNECVCTEKIVNLFGTNNCWEYYFDQISKNNEFIKLNYYTQGKLNYINNYLNPENFIEIRTRFYKNFTLKKHVEDLVLEFYNEKIKNKVTLGIQVRLTDMKQHNNVSGVDKYLNKIKEILNENNKIEQIFLATDDSDVIDIIKNSVTIPVIYYENMYRANKNNPHLNPYDRYDDSRDLHRYKLGVECLEEIFTLTKCDYLLKADISAISMVTCILSENIKKVYCL